MPPGPAPPHRPRLRARLRLRPAWSARREARAQVGQALEILHRGDARIDAGEVAALLRLERAMRPVERHDLGASERR